MPETLPLDGVTVLDLTTLLPGPLATLVLAEAGAEVIKIEKPGGGDELRGYAPRWDEDAGAFALLNRGKRSVTLDLKDPDGRERLLSLADTADVLVEQFRPGVMERLGLGYKTLSARNPKLVYCAITGWGQDGPLRDVAGHDLNYIAETGLLALGGDDGGTPHPPAGLIADIGGGALPGVVNILLALHQAEASGKGQFLDVAMSDGIMAWQWWAQAQTALTGDPPKPGAELLTGGSPRYRVYPTADGKFLAVAPLEQRFWEVFCDVIDLPQPFRDDRRDPQATIDAVAARIAQQPAAHWERAFAGRDACTNVVRSVAEAFEHPHFMARGLFDPTVTDGARDMPALPVPLAPVYRSAGRARKAYPRLGEANASVLPPAAND